MYYDNANVCCVCYPTRLAHRSVQKSFTKDFRISFTKKFRDEMRKTLSIPQIKAFPESNLPIVTQLTVHFHYMKAVVCFTSTFDPNLY